MAKAALTKRTVDAAKKGPKDSFIWDDEVSGFGLKVTPAGSKVYVFQYRIARPGEADRTPAKRYTIGKHGSLTPEQARKRAKELAALVEHGIDPRQRELDAIAAADAAALAAEEKARLEGELSFEKVAALWLEHYEHEKQRRPSSVRLAKTVVNRHLVPKLKGKPIPHIGRVELQPIIDAIPVASRGMRRAVFAYASVLFGWAAKRGDIAGNPLADMAKPDPPKARDRVLSDAELATVWAASTSSAHPFGSFFRLLILTGQRREEVAGMSWSELDRATSTWTIPADRAKNRAVHIVPLSADAVTEIDAMAAAAHEAAARKAKKRGEELALPVDPKNWPKTGYALTTTGRTPISGITKAKTALDVAAAKLRHGKALPAWRIHDLRRTLATGFQRLGVRFEVTEATLNHVSGAKAGVAGIYQRHDWKDEKRAALNAWERHIRAILKAHTSEKIVSIEVARKSA